MGQRSYRVAMRRQILEAGEHVLDLVTQAVEVCVVRDEDLPADTRRDARRNSHLDQSIAEPVRIVAPVCQQHVGPWDGGRPRPDVVGGLACREEHANRAALRVRQDVQFRVQTALRASDQSSAPAF